MNYSWRNRISNNFSYSDLKTTNPIYDSVNGSHSVCSDRGSRNNSAGRSLRRLERPPLEANNVYRHQQQLLLSRDCLRQNIRCLRKSTVEECSRILDSIIGYCQCKANPRPCPPRKRRASSCVDSERVGAGCSTGGCGGYTPSGWNRLMTLHSLQCDNPCCPCRCIPCEDPCTCLSPCPCPCSCCPPCPDGKKRAPRKPKPSNNACNSKQTDENDSAMNARPCTKILGELAFQLERRILDYVFGVDNCKRRRFYGYTVGNISHMLNKECKNIRGEDDPGRRMLLETRIENLNNELGQVGYDMKFHSDFAQQMINRYGLLACTPDPEIVEEFGLQHVRCISKLITQLARGEHEGSNLQTLLRALKYMSRKDGGLLFVW